MANLRLTMRGVLECSGLTEPSIQSGRLTACVDGPFVVMSDAEESIFSVKHDHGRESFVRGCYSRIEWRAESSLSTPGLTTQTGGSLNSNG
jgi:hypothetical protein